jgi:tRNA(fMet)-specific endonuclease VapC
VSVAEAKNTLPALLHEAEAGPVEIVRRGKPVAVERLSDGKRKEGLREYMREVVTKMPAFSYDAKAAEWHARERARLDITGRTMPYAVGQIAAVAVVNALTLVTANMSAIFDTSMDFASKSGGRE